MSGNSRAQVRICSGDRCQKASAWRRIIQLHVKSVTLRCSIKQGEHPVTATCPRNYAQQGPAVPYIGAGATIEPARLSKNTFRNAKVVELQAVKPDIEIGQDRRAGITGVQLRQTQQYAAPGDKTAHIKPRAKPAEWPPIEFGLGDAGENT